LLADECPPKLQDSNQSGKKKRKETKREKENKGTTREKGKKGKRQSDRCVERNDVRITLVFVVLFRPGH
jgi:hypothetical protein